MVYQISVKGVLDKTWSNWLGNVDMVTRQTEEEGVITTLTVEMIDQAALFGILDHIRDLNLMLVSVSQKAENSAVI